MSCHSHIHIMLFLYTDTPMHDMSSFDNDNEGTAYTYSNTEVM